MVKSKSKVTTDKNEARDIIARKRRDASVENLFKDIQSLKDQIDTKYREINKIIGLSVTIEDKLESTDELLGGYLKAYERDTNEISELMLQRKREQLKKDKKNKKVVENDDVDNRKTRLEALRKQLIKKEKENTHVSDDEYSEESEYTDESTDDESSEETDSSEESKSEDSADDVSDVSEEDVNIVVPKRKVQPIRKEDKPVVAKSTTITKKANRTPLRKK